MTIKRKRIYEIIIISLVIIFTSLCAYMGIIAVQKSMKLKLSFAAKPNILCQIEAKTLEEGSAYDVIFRNTSETVIKEGITLNGNVLNIGNLFLSENSQTLGSSFMLKITNLTKDKHLQIYLTSANYTVGFDKDYLIIDYNENAELTLSGISMVSQVELNFTSTTNLSINQPETSAAYSFSGVTEVEPFESYTATLLVNNGYAANIEITTKSGKTLVRDKDYTWNEENGQLVVNSVLEEISISTEWGAKLKTGLEITNILYEVFSTNTVSASANIQPEEVVAGLNDFDDGVSVYAPPSVGPSIAETDLLETVILGYYDQYPSFKTATASRNLDVNNAGDIKLYRDGGTAYILSENKIFANEDSSYLFSNSENPDSDMTKHAISAITFNNFDTSKVEDMSYMFHEFAGSALNLSSFDTSSVTNMTNMLAFCNALISLYVSSFDTSSVTDMSSMFSGCSNLTSLDLSSFDTSKVTSMYRMFSGCNFSTSLDISNFDTSKVTNMSHMFRGCAFESLDLSRFDTSKVVSMDYMFNGCSNLTSLDVSKFDTSKVVSMDYMFSSCSNLTTIYVSDKWSTAKVTSSAYMFRSCTSLVGAIAYDSTKVDVNYANYTTGYLTKAAT